jgi:type VI protein secretion system component VasF
VSTLFEPHDEPQPSAWRDAGEAGTMAPAAESPPADQPRPSARRPIRAAAPKPSGTPTWVIALLLIAAIVIAYLFLTSS